MTATMADFFAGGGGSIPEPTYAGATVAVEGLLCLIDNYRDPWGVDRIRNELAGSDLACWCPLEDEHGNRVPCHADVLLEIANRGDGQ